ncbi:MAG: dTMP kinase [Candidatus Omnitrophota bacterium]
MKKGVFITFEGPEGSGKSTHSKLLCAFLKRRRLNVLHLREPGATKLGELIRTILLKSKNIAIDSKAEAFLYIAARAQLVSEKIIPALESGRIVVCDRFADATLAYQGYGLGLDIKALDNINNFSVGNIKPDITFILDIEARLGLGRSKTAKGFIDRIEKRPVSFHCKVRNGYLALARKDKKRIMVFSAQKNSIHQIQALIQKAAKDAISRQYIR